MVNESDTLTLVCEVFGAPLPTVQWSAPEGTQYSITTGETENYSVVSTLEVDSATVSDGGDYICTGTNGVGNVTVEASASVFVQGGYNVLS